MKHLLLMISFSAIISCADAQVMPENGANRTRLYWQGRSAVFDTYPAKVSAPLSTAKFYYWYVRDTIFATQGGYSGKLLNGSYKEFYANGSLKEEGSFKNGLKSGQWKRWTENGLITEMASWKDGMQTGRFETYAPSGKLAQSGNYYNGKLDGNIYYYFPKDSVSVIYYHRGDTSARPSLIRRISPFGKHGKQ